MNCKGKHVRQGTEFWDKASVGDTPELTDLSMQTTLLPDLLRSKEGLMPRLVSKQIVLKMSVQRSMIL